MNKVVCGQHGLLTKKSPMSKVKARQIAYQLHVKCYSA